MHTVGVLVFPGFELLDVFGPMEMFGHLPNEYELILVAEVAGKVKSNPSINVWADTTTSDNSKFDMLFVPGGPGTRYEVNNDYLIDWVRQAAQNAEYIVSVCTGSALLAKAGVLDGKQATTNKAAFNWVVSQGPDVIWKPSARWVEDGNIFTSSGVSAGMDMALAVIARMHGMARAEEVATWCEYQWHRDPSWDPFAKTHGLD